MTPPDEIVCETAEAFKDACWKHGAFIPAYEIKPGEESTGFKNAPVLVRIVYRPPAPKPPDRCPRCDSGRMAFIYPPCHLGVHEWHAPEAHPTPPPRDAAREAFEAWAPDHGLDVSPSTRAPFQSTGRGGAFYRYESTDIAYQAFLAGRASVKP